MILSIEDDVSVVRENLGKPLIEKSIETYEQIKQDITDSNYKKNWDLFALKYLFSVSVNIFFTKFTQILKHNFDSSSMVIGYTTSYMNGLTFAATFFLQSFRIKRTSDILLFIKVSLITLLLSFGIACYSPSYYIYSLVCIPMTFSRNFINLRWGDLFEARKNPALSRLNENIGIAAGLTIPILFGIICNYIGHYAVILFSLLPLVASIYIYEKYTIPFDKPTEEEETIKNKDD